MTFFLSRTLPRRAAFIAAVCAGILPFSAATAQEAPPLCSDRPGQATPTCVVQPGTFQVETSVMDWTLDKQGGARSDTVLIGDTLLKYGIGGQTELRLSFTPYIHDRTRTEQTVSNSSGIGNVGLSVRHRLVNEDEAGFGLALQPYLELPVGSADVAADTWSAGLLVPVSAPLSGDWSFGATFGIAASANASGEGRHLSYSGVAALSYPISSNVTATGEIYAARDLDPMRNITPVTADFLLAWQPSADWQFDASTYLGVNRDAPGLELVVGFTRRFR